MYIILKIVKIHKSPNIKCGKCFITVLRRIWWQKNKVEKCFEGRKKSLHSEQPKLKYGQFFLLDHSKGFGGKYGVQTDRVDKVRNNCSLY